MGDSSTDSDELVARTWVASTVRARLVRSTLFVLPILAGLIAVALVGRLFMTPSGAPRLAFFAQSLVVGVAAALAAGRITGRLTSLATLLELPLTFPGPAPSRLRLAWRIGSHAGPISADLLDAGLSDDPSQAASEALELVMLAGRHDGRMTGHAERVVGLADLIAMQMELPDTDRQKLSWAVLLHDIGKLTVPAEVLDKRTELSAAEWELLRSHPTAGQALLEPLADWLGRWRFATAQHHEHWDGSGYPRGIGGDLITIAARITSVADAYDAMTAGRPPDERLGHQTARAELTAGAGKQFDPTVVRAFVEATEDRAAAAVPAVGPSTVMTRLTAGVTPTLAAVGLVAALAATLVDVAAGEPDTLALAAAAPANPAVVTPETTAEPTGSPTTIRTVGRLVVPTSFGLPTITTPTTEPSSTASTTTTTVATTTTTEPSTTTTSPSTTTPASTTTSAPPSTTTEPSPPSTVVTVPSEPKGPVANDDIAVIRMNAEATIRVLKNDVPGDAPMDKNSLEIVSWPADGEAWVDGSRIHFAPKDGYVGPAGLTYQVCDEAGLCDTADVIIEVIKPG